MRQIHVTDRRGSTLRLMRWVGGVVAVLLVGVILLVRRESGSPVLPDTVYEDVSLSAVNDKVVLVLSDGKQIGLSGVNKDSLRVRGISIASATEKELIYASDDSLVFRNDETELEMNRVVTTTGGFYMLVLSDGSRVWLNSESELEYPVAFGSKEREVKLKGEAFFEVSRDTTRPFIVAVSDLRTRVLGTSFNIKAYPDETSVMTTLFTGRVEVAPLKDLAHGVVLSPGLQAKWNERTGEMSVHEVDLRHAAAWLAGMFIFDRENIEDITRQIGRWYGVRFVYQINDKWKYTFSGYFSRKDPLQMILDEFTYMGDLEFQIRQDTVYFTSDVKNKMEPPGK